MKNKQFLFLTSILLVVALVLFFVQQAVIQELFSDYFFLFPVWKIYLFHFLLTFFIFALLFFIGKMLPNYVGFFFMGLILLKMVAAVVFLLPLIRAQGISKIPDFLSFFLPYFAFLFLEILLIIRILKFTAPR